MTTPTLPDALPFTCPVCSTSLFARKSWSMESGMGSGHGSCTRCDTFLHLQLVTEGGVERLEAQTWMSYRREQTKGLPWDDRNLIAYRGDLLSEKITRHGWSLLRAVRYALKQGRFQQSFLSRLTFHSGAAAAMREAAIYQRRSAHAPQHLKHVEARCRMLEDTATRCAPDPISPELTVPQERHESA